MRKPLIIAILAIFALFVGLLSLPLLVSSESIKTQLDERIKQITSRKITYEGEPELSFRPYLGLKLNGVALSPANGAEQEDDLLKIETMQFGIKALPLLFGKIRFSEFKLIRPRFNLTLEQLDGSGFSGLVKQSVAPDTASANAEGAENRQTSLSDIKLGHFEIVDGIVEILPEGSESKIKLSNFNAQIDWPDLGSAWNIAGDGVWRSETFSFSNSVNQPVAIFTSGKTELEVQFESPTLAASFDGIATRLSDIQFDGNARFSTPSLPRAYELLFQGEPVELPTLGKFLVEGKVSANNREIQFDETRVELGDNIASGNLILRQNEEQKSKLSGTLAFSLLDITPIFEIFTAQNQDSEEIKEHPLFDNLFDFDIRFSAKNYKFRDNSFGSLAATLMQTGEDWVFEIGEAAIFDGLGVGSISSKLVEEKKEVELKGTLTGVSMGKIAKELYGGEFVTTGNGNVKFNLKAKENANPRNIRSYSGSMNVALTDGKIEGVDLVKAIPALIENNGFVTVDEIKGSTPFNNMSLDLLIYNGVGWITKGSAKGDDTQFRLSGKADLVRGSLAIYTDITHSQGQAAPGQSARIFIGGTVKNPLVTRSPLSSPDPNVSLQQDG